MSISKVIFKRNETKGKKDSKIFGVAPNMSRSFSAVTYGRTYIMKLIGVSRIHFFETQLHYSRGILKTPSCPWNMLPVVTSLHFPPCLAWGSKLRSLPGMVPHGSVTPLHWPCRQQNVCSWKLLMSTRIGISGYSSFTEKFVPNITQTVACLHLDTLKVQQ
jgi:hypothetical protein